MARFIDKNHTRLIKLAQIALLTAIVVVAQLICMFLIPPLNGMFRLSFVLVPIVVGAILHGPLTGAWLGFAFGLAVLFSGDAAIFMQYNPAATIFLVLLKGTLAGLIAGLVFKAFNGKHKYLAVLLSAISAPIVNSGVFLIGCLTLFRGYLPTLAGGAVENPLLFVITGLISFNFVIELTFNIVLTPMIIKVTDLGRKYLEERRK